MVPNLHVSFSHIAVTLALLYVISKIVNYRRGLQVRLLFWQEITREDAKLKLRPSANCLVSAYRLPLCICLVLCYQQLGGILVFVLHGFGKILVRCALEACFSMILIGTTTVYKRFGFDTISAVSFISGPPTLYTANINVARQVLQPSKGRSYWKSPTSVKPLACVVKRDNLIVILTNFRPERME